MSWLTRVTVALFCLAVTLAAPARVIPIFIPVPSGPPRPAEVPPGEAGDYSKIYRVAVLSAFGNKLTLINRHFLVPKTAVLNTSDWGIDALSETTLKSLLAPRFVVKDISANGKVIDLPALQAALEKSPRHPGDVLGKFFAADQLKDVDAIVLAHPVEPSVPGAEMGMYLENPGSEKEPVLVTNYELAVVDARSFKVLGRALSRLEINYDITFAGVRTDGSYLLDDKLSPTEQQKASFKRVTTMLVMGSLPKTVHALRLGIRMVPPRTIKTSAAGYKGIKTIAIASAIGDRMELADISKADKRPVSRMMPIGAWNVDSEAERLARAEISPDYTVKDCPVDRTQLANVSLSDDHGRTIKELKGITLSPECDAYMLILKRPKFRYTQVIARGLNLTNDNGTFSRTVELSMDYDVAVVDSRTNKVLALRTASKLYETPPGHTSIEVDSALWPDGEPMLAPEKAAKLRRVLSGGLADTVPQTLFLLSIAKPQTPPTPPDAAAK